MLQIPPSAPVAKPVSPTPQSSTAANNGADNSGTPRFAALLHKSSADLETQSTEPVKAAKSKKDEKDPKSADTKKPTTNGLNSLAGTPSLEKAPQDPRSLLLSFPRGSAQQKANPASSVQSVDSAPASDAASKLHTNVQLAATQQIAFTANFAKQNASAASHFTAKTDAAKASASSPSAAEPVSAAKDSSSKQHANSDSSDKQSQDSSAAAVPVSKIADAVVPAHATTAPQVLPVQQVPAAYSANTTAKSVAPAPVAHTAEINEPQAIAAARPQSIEFQVPGAAGGDNVNVRVSQRAGDVQVTVRTGDENLAQSLRQHLPELSDKLTQSGVHADLWQPSASASTGGNANSDPQSSEDSRGGGAYQGSAQQNGSQQQQQQRRSAWNQELDTAQNPNQA